MSKPLAADINLCRFKSKTRFFVDEDWFSVTQWLQWYAILPFNIILWFSFHGKSTKVFLLKCPTFSVDYLIIFFHPNFVPTITSTTKKNSQICRAVYKWWSCIYATMSAVSKLNSATIIIIVTIKRPKICLSLKLSF